MKKEMIREMGFDGLLALKCNRMNMDLCLWSVDNVNVANRYIGLANEWPVVSSSVEVGNLMGITCGGRPSCNMACPGGII